METKTEEGFIEEGESLEPKKKRNYWEFVVVIIVTFVLLAVIAVLSFLLIKTFSNKDAEKTSIQNISREIVKNSKIEEVSDRKEEVERDDVPVAKEIIPTEVVIKILNGGAVGGSASRVKELLITKGYKKVEAGNSEKGGYVGVAVFYQAEMKAVGEKVAADLKIKYPTAQAKLGISAEEKSAAIVVILGK